MKLSPFVDKPNDGVENLVDVGVVLGGGLDEGHAELGSEVLALGSGDGPLAVEVALVGNEDHGDVRVFLLDPEDASPQLVNRLEADRRGDAVHQNEPLPRLHVLVPQRRVFLLSGCIHDVQNTSYTIHLGLFGV